MTRLRHRDLDTFSQALLTLYAATDAETLSARILAALRGLFDCDFASFSLMDLRQASFHASALAPLVPDWPGTETHQRHLSSDPAAAHIMRTREPYAVKISDFVSLREYHNLGVYTEVFGRVGCDRRLGFAVQDGTPVSLIATLNRKGRDFSDEDRRLLDLLRPHLLQANAQAHADKQMRSARERERAQMGNLSGAGLGELDAVGRVLWLTPRAESLLGEFFPRQTLQPAVRRLPAGMEKQLAPIWQERWTPATGEVRQLRRLVWQFPGPDQRTLKVRLVADPKLARWQILLEETTVAAPVRSLERVLKLTPREAEVLHWLKQGKTNEEIGIILTAAKSTVGKHVEHIFAKLNVETRTAAANVAAEAQANSK